MKIKQITIKNFRSVKDETIIFPDSGILTLVGPNNAGKSNILRAIENILGDSWFSGDKAELNDHFMKHKENVIEIEIDFDDNRKVVFKSNEKWATYYDEQGNTIYSSRGNIKDDLDRKSVV